MPRSRLEIFSEDYEFGIMVGCLTRDDEIGDFGQDR